MSSLFFFLVLSTLHRKGDLVTRIIGLCNLESDASWVVGVKNVDARCTLDTETFTERFIERECSFADRNTRKFRPSLWPLCSSSDLSFNRFPVHSSSLSFRLGFAPSLENNLGRVGGTTVHHARYDRRESETSLACRAAHRSACPGGSARILCRFRGTGCVSSRSSHTSIVASSDLSIAPCNSAITSIFFCNSASA